MGIAELLTWQLSGSEAPKLDGIVCLVSLATGLVASWVGAQALRKPTEEYPYGRFTNESNSTNSEPGSRKDLMSSSSRSTPTRYSPDCAYTRPGSPRTELSPRLQRKELCARTAIASRTWLPIFSRC
jgi:hypothetical protein